MTAAPQSRFDWKWAGYWTAVFGLNLPLPCLFVIFHGPSIGVGLLAGLAVLHWVGVVLCGFRFRVGRSLVWGGWLLAISQFIPVFQIVCFAVALSLWEGISGSGLYGWEYGVFTSDESRGLKDNLGTFVVVLITAWPMGVTAVLLGALFRWHHGDTPIWRNPRANADPEAAGP